VKISKSEFEALHKLAEEHRRISEKMKEDSYNPGLLGRVRFDDHIWRGLDDARLKETMMGAIIEMHTVHGLWVGVDYLPKAQARRLYSLAQEMEEKVREERLVPEMEVILWLYYLKTLLKTLRGKSRKTKFFCLQLLATLWGYSLQPSF
jgi:hypothetical protein